jgi:hypothetical protein
MQLSYHVFHNEGLFFLSLEVKLKGCHKFNCSFKKLEGQIFLLLEVEGFVGFVVVVGGSFYYS